MTDEPTNLPSVSSPPAEAEESIESQLERLRKTGKWTVWARFITSALGAIPAVGGVIAGIGSLSAEREQGRTNELLEKWLESHQKKLELLGATLVDVCLRLEQLGEEAIRRVDTEEYQALVHKGFKVWDNADTSEKRTFVKTLLTNAAATKLCNDDIVRLFIEWIDHYHEVHFKVIREVYRKEGITRNVIWANIYGERVQENAAEADLFKLLIRDLSTGGVIRQHRPTDAAGNYLKKRSPKRQSSGRVLKSAFDDNERYELTALGSQFVHYTMDEVVPRLGH